MNNEVLVVGSVAFDTIENANGRVKRVLGGAASYASVCASYFASPCVVAVVGTDFTDEDRAALAEETPVERLGTAEDVARSIVFLCDESAGYITGQVLGVNGGLVI